MIVGSGATATDAVRLAERHQPDIVLLDLDIPGSGLTAIPAIYEVSPQTKVIILTASLNENDLVASLRAGAKGYALKGISASELAVVARSVMNGQGYVPPALAAKLISHGSVQPVIENDSRDELSDRERQIFDLVAEGLSNRQIAVSLNLTEKTIKNYMTAIMQKLRVRSRVEVALLARRSPRG
jgi:DNA-binding NarL/FixJ family response regulator